MNALTSPPLDTTAQIIHALSFTDYLRLPYISAHGLMRIERSPAHYRASREQPHAPTPAQALGTLAHLMILEPERVVTEMVVAPDCDRRTKAGKADWEAFQSESAGKLVVAKDQLALTLAMRESVMAQPYARALLAAGFAETTVIAELEGVTVKGRPDWLPHDLPVIVDLKTAVDASPKGFARAAANFAYHLQAALYTDLIHAMTGQRCEFVFLVVENEPPHGVALYQLDADAIERGRVRYQQALETYQHCLDTDDWPGYATEIQALELPRWAA